MRKYIVKGNGLGSYGLGEMPEHLARATKAGRLLTRHSFLYAEPWVSHT